MSGELEVSGIELMPGDTVLSVMSAHETRWAEIHPFTIASVLCPEDGYSVYTVAGGGTATIYDTTRVRISR